MMPHMVAGNYGITLSVLFRSAQDNAPIDLTGKTITVRWSLAGGATQTRTMTALDQATAKGTAEYTFVSGDLPSGGELRCEFVASQSPTSVMTSLGIAHFYVRPAL